MFFVMQIHVILALPSCLWCPLPWCPRQLPQSPAPRSATALLVLLEWPFVRCYSHIYSEYDFWHAFAGKGVLNVMGGSPTSDFLPFLSYPSVALTLVCKLASFYHFYLLFYY